MKNLLFSVFLLFSGVSLAQNPDSLGFPYFNVLSPGHIANVYESALSQFSNTSGWGAGVSNGDITAELAIAGDDQGLLCDTNNQIFSDKIVVIRRGECEFSRKALNAQQQGAVGVIIVNFENIVIEMGAGTLGNQVAIPVIMVPLWLGDLLWANILQGENVVGTFSGSPHQFGKIIGRVNGDKDNNCLGNPDEPGLRNWLVQATGLHRTFMTTTRPDGSFLFYADSTNSPYSVSATPFNQFWELCSPNPVPVLIMHSNDTAFVEFHAQATLACPQLNTEIVTPFLRRCFPNTFGVIVCNNGAATATDAYVLIHLPSPEFEPITNANLPYTIDANGDYRFELGDLEISECISFKFDATVSCEETILGQTLCYSAHAFPDTFCIETSPEWNGADIKVNAACNNGSPSFTIRNDGEGPMLLPSSYSVFGNLGLVQTESFQLGVNEELTINTVGDGTTWRVEARQVPGHPNAENPSATLEGCTNNTQFSIGYFLGMPVYDPSDAYDNECTEIIGAYDPNDKQGFPLGVTDEHLILPNTDIEYLIRFQNTGTDTAFNIVIRDTLSGFFDANTVRPGVSSATYDFEMTDGHILVFRFNNIRLVDSFANEPASHGFVKFRVQQQPDLPWGTTLLNNAAIYFDFNPPVITNTTWHKLGEIPHTSPAQSPAKSENSLLSISPNPASTGDILRLNTTPSPGANWRLYSASGVLVKSGNIADGRIFIPGNDLTAGVYWFELTDQGSLIGRVKWVLH